MVGANYPLVFTGGITIEIFWGVSKKKSKDGEEAGMSRRVTLGGDLGQANLRNGTARPGKPGISTRQKGLF